MTGLTCALGAVAHSQTAQPAPTVPSLETALAARPWELAQSYAVTERALKMMSMVAHGNTTIVTPQGEINAQNAELWRKALEARLSIYEQAIERRGYSSFAGTYHLAWISATCLESGSYFAGMAQAGEIPRFTITQEKFHLHIIFGDSAFENAPATAAENSFVFADPMNGDYVHIGQLSRGRIEIRPQPDVLRTWPEWSSPPSKSNISCAVVLAPGERRPGETDAVAQAAAEVLKPHLEAADRGDAAAQALLGDVYESGDGAPRDLVKAAAWYRKAANQGNAAAELRLAAMYEEGRGVPLNPAEAFTLYKQAANAGIIDAQGKLGAMYVSGRGVAPDPREGAAWLRKASIRLADFFRADSSAHDRSRPNVAPGSSVTKTWLRMAADQNFAEAQFSLGHIAQEQGIGRSDQQQPFQEAAAWYRKAAEQGYASAEESLAVLHSLGWGVSKDEAEAVKWLERAAAHGSASAQNSLGGHYHNGDGVPKDYIEAYKWYEIAASRSSTTGIVTLAVTHQLATGNRYGLATIMTADQIAEAKRRARAWLAAEKR